jgi:ribosomal-protein-alanine N-acetyltransferase
MPAGATTLPECKLEIRPLRADDLDAVAAIQEASPEASHWNPADYLGLDSTVAVCNGTIAGFLVTRTVSDGESEILNLAVAPRYRRCGVAKHLISDRNVLLRGVVFLEVRASNTVAQNLYKSLGFQEVAWRPGYYENPPESAIVMKFHSC